MLYIFFFKQKTAYEIKECDWSSDVCSSDLSTENPYNQVNITIIGNLVARKIPVLIVANKTDLKKSDIKKIEVAFPDYDVIGISAKNGKNLEEFYESIFELSKKV